MKQNKNKKSTWKAVFSENDSFLNAYPEFKKDKKVISTLKMMSLWSYQTRLKQEERYVELVWIQPNFTEILINSMLSVYFLTVGGKERSKENDNLVHSLNLQHKIKLLYALNLVDRELFHNLEEYRAIRNNLIHKLMKQVQLGKDVDKECKRFCEIGFKLQDRLHDISMQFVRKHAM
jgi:hypothetical protein